MSKVSLMKQEEIAKLKEKLLSAKNISYNELKEKGTKLFNTSYESSTFVFKYDVYELNEEYFLVTHNIDNIIIEPLLIRVSSNGEVLDEFLEGLSNVVDLRKFYIHYLSYEELMLETDFSF